MGRIADLWNKVNEWDAKIAGRQFVWPYQHDDYAGSYFSFATGSSNPSQEGPPSGFIQLVDRVFRANSVVFAAELFRISVFSEARFIYRAFEKGKPGHLFSDPSLDILEHPWPRGTTGDLLTNMLLSADLGGNAFVTRSVDGPDRLRVLRPDWVTIVMGDSSGRPVESASQLDAEIIGFIYNPNDGTTEPEILLADEVAHWAPIPDPLARFRGMSWITPVIREVQADQAATAHKNSFFTNGATPQLVVSFDATVTEEQFKQFTATMDSKHNGPQNAYKTLYLGGGADVKTVGANLQQLDFSNTQGKGETRIAAASGISPVLIPLSEGLSGSSLNAGNYQAARDLAADRTFRPLWRGACGALGQIVPPPGRGAELWYLDEYIPFLREDSLKAANVEQIKAMTITGYVKDGFTAESAVLAVANRDVSLLVHTGLPSVQLQAELASNPAVGGTTQILPAPAPVTAPVPAPATNGKKG